MAYTIPFLNQLWFFLTPVVYSAAEVPDPWKTLYGLNPMSSVVGGIRWSLFGTNEASGPMIAMSAVVAAALFVTGAMWFRRRERTFVDSIGSGGR